MTSRKMKVLVFLFPFITFICCYEPIEVKVDLTMPVFTAEMMKQYNGAEEDKPIYMGVRGVVFDVSAGKSFYGKGTGYNSLTGMDCSKAVAKMSLEPEDLTHDISDLTDAELKSLDEVYTGVYLAKYPIVGYMDYLIEQVEPSKGFQAHDDEL